MNVPAFRFPEFEGVWKPSKLKNITRIYDGTHQTPNYVAKGVPFYSVEHVTANQFERTKFISEEVFEKENKRVKLERDDILMTRIGDIGTARLVDWDVSASFYVSLALIKADPTKFESGFLSAYFGSDYLSRELHRRTIHVAFPKKINLGEIGKTALSLPSLPEQKKIAAFLGVVDAKIAALRARVAGLERYKRGLMQALFSQTLRFTKEDGTTFPDWEKKRLGEVANIVGGGTPDTNVLEYWNGSIVWFTPSEIKKKYLTTSARRISDSGLSSSSAKMLPIGALVLSTRATVGDVGIATQACATNQGFQSLEMKEKNYNEFWYYWLKQNKKALLRRSAGSTFLEIGKSEVQKLPVMWPHPDEQAKVAGALSAMDVKIVAVTGLLDQMQHFKKGLLQQMFV